MGTLHYGAEEQICTIDDRELLHLQIVITDKLRNGDHFTFSCDDGHGARTTFWMSPGIPLRFDYDDASLDIDRDWLAALDGSDATLDAQRFETETDLVYRR